jgi:RNA ligase
LTEERHFDSIDQIVKLCEELPGNQEGFVVRFDNGYRVKIKSLDYLRIHKLISRCTPIAVWEMLLAKDDIEALKKQVPEEIRLDFDVITEILNEKYFSLVQKIKEEVEKTQHLSDKELGLSSNDFKSFIFAARKNDLFGKIEEVGSKQRLSAFKSFYPKANKLEGYSPTNSMNNFQEN